VQPVAPRHTPSNSSRATGLLWVRVRCVGRGARQALYRKDLELLSLRFATRKRASFVSMVTTLTRSSPTINSNHWVTVVQVSSLGGINSAMVRSNFLAKRIMRRHRAAPGSTISTFIQLALISSPLQRPIFYRRGDTHQ
jgi:hypothetical protein